MIDSTVPPAPHRAVRSYVIREGRMTRAQARALAELMPRFGVVTAALADPVDLFARRQPLVLEIGIGNGENLVAMARAAPDHNFLGCEVHRPGLGHALQCIVGEGLSNVRLLHADALDVLSALPPRSLDRLCMFFPDPWPKKRHHKRRLLNAATLELIGTRLHRHGIFCFATDNADYAEGVAALLDAGGVWRNVAGARGRAPRPCWRFETRFEQRAIRAGRAVHDLGAMLLPGGSA